MSRPPPPPKPEPLPPEWRGEPPTSITVWDVMTFGVPLLSILAIAYSVWVK